MRRTSMECASLPKEGDERTEMFVALAKAQGEFANAKKTNENPFFHSKYADLNNVLKVVRPVLSKNGLCLIQSPRITEDGTVEVETILTHEKGGVISDTISHKLSGNQKANDLQKAGTVITYLRRYSLQAFLGIGSEDDDGNSFVEAPKKVSAPRQRKRKEEYGTEGERLRGLVMDFLGVMEPNKAAQIMGNLTGQKAMVPKDILSNEELSKAAADQIDDLVKVEGSTPESIVAQITSDGVF